MIGCVLGLLVGILCVALIEAVSATVYPPPPELDFSDSEAVRAHIQSLPVGAFLFVLTAHAAGAFMAGFTTRAISRDGWRAGSLMLGGILLLAGAATLLTVPHPFWFAVADLLIYLPAAVSGGRFAGRHFEHNSPTATVTSASH